MTLVFGTRMPRTPADGTVVLVLLHGRGSDEEDLLGLADLFPPEWIVVAPRAPFAGLPWGYGPGYAWYRYAGEGRPEPDSFEQAQRALGDWLAELPAALPVRAGPVVLGGFSQGGTMALGHALRHPGVPRLVAVLSGFLAAHPSIAVTPETVGAIDIFWGHGTEDPSIPYRMALAGWDRLTAAGARLTARSYRMGHGVTPEEVADLIQWVRARTGAAERVT